MAKKITSATKLVIPCRISFANIFEPKSINGSEAKYSVSCLVPKDDKKTLLAIHKAVEAAKEDGKVRKWGGKLPPNLKLPLRDGDIDRPDDETYQDCMFVNATSKDAPGIVDRRVQPVTDPMLVYSGCYCNVSVNFYPFNDIETISPRPMLFITGDQAHSKEFSEDAFQRAAEPKELHIVPGAGHVDLYDRVNLIPWDKLTAFFGKHLA